MKSWRWADPGGCGRGASLTRVGEINPSLGGSAARRAQRDFGGCSVRFWTRGRAGTRGEWWWSRTTHHGTLPAVSQHVGRTRSYSRHICVYSGPFNSYHHHGGFPHTRQG